MKKYLMFLGMQRKVHESELRRRACACSWRRDLPVQGKTLSRLHDPISAVSYSSLGYLGRFPVDRVKIAQSFIVNLTGETSNMAIVKAAIGLARELNLDVLVAGIETAEQLGRISSWGCRNVQGDYFSKPLPASELSTLLLADTHAHAASTASPREAA